VKVDLRRRQTEEREGERPQPPAPAQAGVDAVLAAQRSAGNRAVAALLQREGDGATVAPYVATIDGEKVEVASKDEEAEAKQIIEQIEKQYGIEVASLRGAAAVRKNYPSAPKDVRKGVKTTEWKMKELRAIGRALAHFAPILGEARKKSKRKGAKQEITSVSKVAQSIDVDDPSGVLDTTTLGEFFEDQKNFSMFTAGTDSEVDFPGENEKQLEATAVHEIAHGLMEYALDDFIKATGYWRDKNTKSGKADAEAPPTAYGDTNASEDLSESVMFYFVDEQRLLDGDGSAAAGAPGNPCPKRWQAIHELVTKWAPQIGDFPLPQGNTAIA